MRPRVCILFPRHGFIIISSAFGEARNLQALYSAFPDGHHILDDYITQDDCVVTKGRFEGTHRGGFRGTAPTGAKVSFSVIHVDRFRDGKLVSHFGQPDMLALLRQIGAVKLEPTTK
jgi:predicted ester cyclase